LHPHQATALDAGLPQHPGTDVQASLSTTLMIARGRSHIPDDEAATN